MKKLLIISAFYLENDISRPYQIKQYFESMGISVKVITASFVHSMKKQYFIKSNDVIQVKVPSYKKTFSFRRIFSHFIFALKIKKYAKNDDYDIIYMPIPLNFSAFLASTIAKKRNKYIIIDVIDIWPHTTGKFPFNIVFKLWGSFRTFSIKKANKILLETNAYSKIIEPVRQDYNVVYLSKNSKNLFNKDYSSICNIKNEIKIAYLGNFSESYDFDSLLSICKLLSCDIKTKVVFIGDGHLKSHILSLFRDNMIEFQDFGVVFDETEKFNILSKCTFGFNSVKNDILVGLSYKSIDYLSYGLPVLNSISYDTWLLIEKYNAGINFDSPEIAFKKILSLSENDYIKMKNGADNLFDNIFSKKAFFSQMNDIFKEESIIQ